MRKLITGLFGLFVVIGFYYGLMAEVTRPFLSVVGFCKMADGLGRQCPDLIEALAQDFSIGFYPLKASVFKDVPAAILPIIENPKKTLGTVVFYNDTLWRPHKKGSSYGALNVFKTKAHKDQIRICYTMLESTRIPDEWVNILNNYFDLVCVPDPFLETAFRDSGVKIPVFTLPLGLNLTPFLKEPIKSSYHPVFRFGTLGLLYDRKNQKKLMEAFDKAFTQDDAVELVIHARRADEAYKKECLDLAKRLSNPKIKMNLTMLDNQAYLEFFKSLDMLVNVSKGEGFSIQPREAMALGIPVLVSNNTAQTSIVNSSLVASVETLKAEPCFYSYFNKTVGEFFDLEVDDLALALKTAYHNRQALLEKAERCRHYAALFDYTSIKPLYKNIVKPKVCKLGQKNIITEEGIETNSIALKEKYERLTGANL